MLNYNMRLKLKNEFDANLVYGSRKFIIDTKRDKLIKKPTVELLNILKRVSPGVYKIKKEYFIGQNRCPLCLNKKYYFLVERMGITVCYCKDCGFGFQNPKLKKNILDKLYRNDIAAHSAYSSKSQFSIDIKRYDYGLSILDGLKLPSKELLIDVGCGNGLSLKRAVKKGWKKCLGIEPNQRYELITSQKIKIINVFFEEAFQQINEKADAIMMWDVLEHIYEPVIFLQRIKRIMKNNALLLVMVPNLNSLATRLIREKSPTFNWAHLNYFTAFSLKKILLDCEFKIELIETVISEIGNINNYLSFDDPYLGENEKTVTLDFLTPEYIHRQMLGSRLFVIARNII